MPFPILRISLFLFQLEILGETDIRRFRWCRWTLSHKVKIVSLYPTFPSLYAGQDALRFFDLHTMPFFPATPAPSPFEEPYVVPPTTTHTHTIIALHGRGSQGPEFASELFENKTSSQLNLQEHFPSWRWVFPSSQERWSTVFEEKMDEWFDIYSLTNPSDREELQKEGVKDSINFLQNIIYKESRKVGERNIILLGLSQGNAIGLLTLLASQLTLGAYVGLSGWLPASARINNAFDTTGDTSKTLVLFFQEIFHLRPQPGCLPSVLQTPVFLGHAADDEIVDVDLGRDGCNILAKLGTDVTWTKHAEGGHLGFLETRGLDDIVDFLIKKVIERKYSIGSSCPYI